MKTTFKTKQKTNITLMLYLKNGAFFLRCYVLPIVLVTFLAANHAYSQGSNRGKLTKVVIDPGHGGKDPGARGRLAVEKDIVLSVALKLGKLINENFGDVKVLYTRETDVFIPLDERSQKANKANANLFISIHANSNKSSVPYGAETYVMGLHKSADNFEVAATENSAIILEDDYTSKYEGFNPKSVESYIIFSMMQSKFLDQSLYFAQMAQNQFVNHADRSNRGVKQAGFLVLWRTAMPSVLVELGFISNAQEEKYMMSEKGQNELAESLFKAFKGYKQSYETSKFVDFTKSDLHDTSSTKKVVKAKPEQSIAEDRSTKREEESSKKQDGDKGILFKVQIAASVGKPLSKNLLRNLGDGVDVIKVGNIYKYTKGAFGSIDQANKLMSELKRKHKDAFVIATENGVLISVNEAIQKQR